MDCGMWSVPFCFSFLFTLLYFTSAGCSPSWTTPPWVLRKSFRLISAWLLSTFCAHPPADAGRAVSHPFSLIAELLFIPRLSLRYSHMASYSLPENTDIEWNRMVADLNILNGENMIRSMELSATEWITFTELPISIVVNKIQEFV